MSMSHCQRTIVDVLSVTLRFLGESWVAFGYSASSIRFLLRPLEESQAVTRVFLSMRGVVLVAFSEISRSDWLVMMS